MQIPLRDLDNLVIVTRKCAEKERHTEDVAVPNVAPGRRKNVADVVAMPARILRAAAQRESNDGPTRVLQG